MPPPPHAPPLPARVVDVVEELHGVRVVDPYRWLEDGEDEAVRAWSAAQTEYTEALLRDRPGHAALVTRLAALLRVGAVEPPTLIRARDGTPQRFFYRRQGPAQDQPLLFVRDGDGGSDRTVLDPNGMDAEGTASIDWWTPSPDGRLVAYGISSGGDENSTLRVRDVETGQDLPSTEVISRARYSTLAWLPDGSGFFYARYPAPGAVPAGEERYHRQVYLHHLGHPPDADALVFGEGRAMTDTPAVEISRSGRWLVCAVHMGWSRRELYLADLAAAALPAFAPLAVPESDALYDAVVCDDHLWVRSNDGAPTYALYRVDPLRPARADWELVVPAAEDVLVAAIEVGGYLVVHYLRHARSVLVRFSLRGERLEEVRMPVLGTVGQMTGQIDDQHVYFHFSSFTMPGSVYRLEVANGAVTVWAQIEPPIDPDDFVVTQELATSRDGTRVPMFIVHRRGLALDGSAPTLLGGYGGFNISQLPAWSGGRYALLERGGVSVVANLRGGGEYGERWHRAGMLESKQNVFDDFYAVAEHLVARGYTSASRLAILGGSNGGLLIGAAITQRPELFRAAVCTVPLLDMLRYHRFLIARLWVAEYGSAEDAEQFPWLWAYSPYHHVEAGKRYPAVLFATAEGDSRVDPLHARKMAARLQAAASDPTRPVLLRIETKAGHGAGKPISKRIDEAAAIYGFLLWQLGLDDQAPA